MKTLIIYASKYGCAEKCAKLIAEELNDQVNLINIKKEKNTNLNLEEYSKIIIGGSIYIGKIQKEITEFCNKNLNKLKEKQLGLFICAMAEGDAVTTELSSSFPAELLSSAIAKEHLGGEFTIDKMGFLDKLIVKKVSKVTANKSNILTEKIHTFAQSMK